MRVLHNALWYIGYCAVRLLVPRWPVFLNPEASPTHGLLHVPHTPAVPLTAPLAGAPPLLLNSLQGRMATDTGRTAAFFLPPFSTRGDRRLAGGLFVFLLTITAAVGSLVLLIPMLPLIFIPVGLVRDFFRIYTATFAAMWLGLASGLVERLGGTKILIYGDPLVYGERTLLISNHRTRIDWMFLWCLTARYGFMRSARFVCKGALKSLWFYGWSMQTFFFPFLSRSSTNRHADLDMLGRMCRYLTVERRLRNSVVLFPEGTDLSDSNLRKDKEFAESRGLPVYHHVLHPRLGAFGALSNGMRGHLDALYDVTMAYVDYTPGERPCELAVLKGRFPKEVHFYIKRYDAEALSTEPAALEQFLARSFDAKEAALSHFAAHQCYPAHLTTHVPTPPASPHPRASPLPASKAFDFEHQAKAAFRLSCLAWALLLSATAWVVLRHPRLSCVYTVLGCLVHVAVTRFADGWALLEMRLPVWDAPRKKAE